MKSCLCCGLVQDNLFSIVDCNFAYIFDRLINQELWSNKAVCNLCHHILRKFHRFIQKIEENKSDSQSGKFINLVESRVTCIDTNCYQAADNNMATENIKIKEEPTFVEIEYDGIKESCSVMEKNLQNCYENVIDKVQNIPNIKAKIKKTPRKRAMTKELKNKLGDDIEISSKSKDMNLEMNQEIDNQESCLNDEKKISIKEEPTTTVEIKIEPFQDPSTFKKEPYSYNEQPTDEVQQNTAYNMAIMNNYAPIIKAIMNKTPIKKDKIKKTGVKRTPIKRVIVNNDNETKVSKRKHMKSEKREKHVKPVTITLEEFMKEREIDRTSQKYLQMPYKCENCIVGFRYEFGLNSHMTKYHAPHENGAMCTICKCTNASKTSIESHMKRHFKRFECVQCGKRAISYYPLLEHYFEAHSTDKHLYKCPLCEYTTNKHRLYRTHKQRHSDHKVNCTICHKEFLSPDILRQHMRFIHEGVKGDFTCEKCNKNCKNYATLKLHMRTHEKGNFYCLDCQTSYKSEDCLKVHLKKHSKHGAKRFECDYCGKNYSCKQLLANHIAYDHLNIIQHTCTECFKIYKTRAGLLTHIKFGHGDKKQLKNKICEHCGTAFASKAVLLQHIRIHTGERPLQCDECTATFRQAGALATHKKLVHKKIPY